MWEFARKTARRLGRSSCPGRIRAGSLLPPESATPCRPERREKWEKALRLGFTGIAAQFGTRPDLQQYLRPHPWRFTTPARRLRKPECELGGPLPAQCDSKARTRPDTGPRTVGSVVAYSHVYTDALGLYYTASAGQSRAGISRQSGSLPYHSPIRTGSNVGQTVDDPQPLPRRRRRRSPTSLSL